MIDKATAERIKAAADIVEVVSDYVRLTRRGSNFMGLCPFHNERTPSFSVNRRRNMCYCFSCHKGGSPVNFIMEKEGINYHDALLQLAKKYGIEVKERELTDEERAAQSRRESMLVANEWAMRQMESNLHDTAEGRDVGMAYFNQRGLTPQAIKSFHLGYALDSPGALADAARKAGLETDVLKEVGLLGTSQQGRTYDRFRGRVIFPVLNTAGKVVAFGGRDLKGGPAKYINSPESDIYKKNRELYGIYQARSEIVRQDKCFLVEGYMDVIGMWQAGMENVIASSGTALTDGQIALIHRFTQNITLLYDGDAAGIKASLRGIDMLLSHKMKVKVLLLPDGHDPDSFARINTPEQFRKYVEDNETDIIRFKTKVLMDQSGSDPLKRSQAIRSVVESLACIPDPITAQVYIQECAQLLGVSEELISTEVQRARVGVLERLRTERRLEDERDRIDRAMAASDPSASASAQAPAPGQDSPASTAEAAKKPAVSPLYPLEKAVARYFIRYGMLDFCEGVDDRGNTVWLNVAEYILSEMEADELQFEEPTFRTALDAVIDMRPKFLDDLDDYGRRMQQEYDTMRAEGQQKIAALNLDMRQIKREEDKLEETITERMAADRRLYAAEYAGRTLASHEDDALRKLAIRFLNDLEPLSRRFDKMGQNQPEHDRLIELVPRALDEWKDAIINQRIRRLMARIEECAASGDIDEQLNLMRQINEYKKIAAQLARNIGDRIITPRRR